MFCPNCGKEQIGNPAFCSNCGAKFIQEPIMQPGVAYAGTVQYAGFWRRFGAALIDGILLGIVTSVVSSIIIAIGFSSSEEDIVSSGTFWMAYGIAMLVNIVISWLYYTLMESSSKQATLGKMALGIIVTDNQGKRISFGRATGRHFAKIISTIIIYIGFFMIAFTEKKQGLHDLMANTLVVLK